MNRKARFENLFEETPRRGEKVVAVEFDEYHSFPRVVLHFESGRRLSVAVRYPFGKEGADKILNHLDTLYNVDQGNLPASDFENKKDAILRGAPLDLKTNLIELGQRNPALRAQLRPILDHLTQKESRFWSQNEGLGLHGQQTIKDIKESLSRLREALNRGDSNAGLASLKSAQNSLDALKTLLPDLGTEDLMNMADVIRDW